MKLSAVLFALAMLTSCTTVANRRDLYSPYPYVSYAPTYTTVTTATTRRTETEETAAPAYRY